jgi:arylsulfatase A-like enzyme
MKFSQTASLPFFQRKPVSKQPHSFARLLSLSLLVLLPALAKAQAPAPVPAPNPQPVVPHVIQISVDALGAKYLDKFLQESPAEFNNFERLIKEGASTLNARTDHSHTITLPNHTCMVTGRPVQTPTDWPEAQGHGWTWNSEFPSPDAPASLHATNPAKGYTSSTFEVAHDHGMSTAIYSGKTKFRLYTVSFGAELGAENPKGRNKIDFSAIGAGTQEKAIAGLKENKPAYTFLHYPDPDVAGHAFGYLGAEYRDSVKAVNGYLGELLNLVETDPEWKDRTIIILSADHGGKPGTKSHGDAADPYDYTIPFMVWGHSVPKGVDLYKLNATTRTDPGEGRPMYAPTGQPIRNGDGGNLALELLGLPAIPGSHINDKQDLMVR